MIIIRHHIAPNLRSGTKPWTLSSRPPRCPPSQACTQIEIDPRTKFNLSPPSSLLLLPTIKIPTRRVPHRLWFIQTVWFDCPERKITLQMETEEISEVVEGVEVEFRNRFLFLRRILTE